MKFGEPMLLWLLVVIAALAALDFFRQGSLAALWPKIGRLRAGRDRVDLTAPAARPRARWFFWSGLALAIVALAQPRFGAADMPLEQAPREVLVALDLSRSMLARDVKPSRLEHGKLLVSGLLDKLAGEHVGLALFAGSAYLQIPLSPDYEILTTLLPPLSPDAFPRGGSDFAAMLQTGLESFSADEGVQRTLIVISDGEAFDEKWKPLLARYRERNIRILAVAVGLGGGTVIPTPDGTALKDPATGLEVITRLKPATLQALAAETKGAYLEANSWVNLAESVRQLHLGEKKSAAVRKDEHRLVERYRWVLAPALVLLWLGYCYELPVRPARRRLAGRKEIPSPGPLSSGSRVVASLLLAILFVSTFDPRLLAHDPEPVSSDMAEQDAEIDDPDRPTPMARIGSMVGRRISELLSRRDVNADDYAGLVIDMMAFAENHLKARQRFPNSVLDDAMLAAKLGESIDPQGGDWTRFRTELATMRQANNSPWKSTLPDAAGKSDLGTGFDPKHEMESNGKGPGGTPSDPAAQRALDELKRKVAGNSAFGTMADEKQSGGRDLSLPPAPADDMQVIAPDTREEEQEIAESPQLVLPLQRLALVRAQDTPAKLFQMLEGKDNNFVREGPDW